MPFEKNYPSLFRQTTLTADLQNVCFENDFQKILPLIYRGYGRLRGYRFQNAVKENESSNIINNVFI